MANVLLRYAASNQPFAGHPPLYHGPLAKGAQHVKDSLAEFRVRRRESSIIRFLPRHVRGRKHFARSERRIVRYQRTTEAQNEAVLSRKSGQATFSTVSAPLQRGLSRAYFTYDRDCDGRLRPSPFREGIGYLRPRRFAHCIDFITDQGRSGFPLRPCALLVVVIYGWRPM